MPSQKCPDLVIDALNDAFGPGVIWDVRTVSPTEGNDQTQVTIDPDANTEVLLFLRNLEECPFEMCSDITAYDKSKLPGFDPETDRRFVVVYLLQSVTRNVRLILHAPLTDPLMEGREELPKIHTAWPIYRSSIWTEREVYEMFGIDFTNHPNLKRLLTPEYFDEKAQYPLRKDYPLRGKGDRGAFPVYNPEDELDLSRYGY